MNKPYVSTEDSDTGSHVSMVTDFSMMPGEVILACNNCYNGLSAEDMEAHPDMWLDWQDLGDSGVLCPACKDSDED